MGKSEFTLLNLMDKIKTLYEDGVFVTAIRYYGYKVNLYLFQGTYFEVFYNHKDDCIEKIIQLDFSHTRMKFYTDQIKFA